MTEEEALIRAREAAIASGGTIAGAEMVRDGKRDSAPAVQAALRALLDLDKPLPVDRDLADLRELLAAFIALDGDGDTEWAEKIRQGDGDVGIRRVCAPVFRAIIQRRIEEAGK